MSHDKWQTVKRLDFLSWWFHLIRLTKQRCICYFKPNADQWWHNLTWSGEKLTTVYKDSEKQRESRCILGLVELMWGIGLDVTLWPMLVVSPSHKSPSFNAIFIIVGKTTPGILYDCPCFECQVPTLSHKCRSSIMFTLKNLFNFHS